MEAMDTENKPNIVITGFDVFRDYKVNPSWEAVKSLKWTNDRFNLIKLKVPVTYSDAKSNVKHIWDEYKPILVIHVGVSHLANCLTLEDCAVRDKHRYDSPDVDNVRLSTGRRENNDGLPLNYLRTGLDVDAIVRHINQLNAGGQLSIQACRSSKAGEYLCEYIYRCSLKRNTQRSLFIHVPQLSSTVSPDVLASGIDAIIQFIVQSYYKE